MSIEKPPRGRGALSEDDRVRGPVLDIRGERVVRSEPEAFGARPLGREGEELEVGLIVLVHGRAEPGVPVVGNDVRIVGSGARRSCCGEQTGGDGDGREGVLEVDVEHSAPPFRVVVGRYDPRTATKVGRKGAIKSPCPSRSVV